ncbi:MAG: GAF domain-containing protein, partial [Anaerolineales bacterium]
GLLNLDKTQTGFYTEHDAQLTAAFANQAALALQNARLFEAERRQLRLAQTLQAVGALLTAQMSLSDVFESIFDLLARVIAYDSVSVQMLDEEDQMVLAAGRGFPDLEQAQQNVRAVSEQRPAERWLQHRLMVIADTRTDERWVQAPGSDYIRSWVGAALLVRGRLVGILTADNATPNAYDAAAGETVLAFANQAAVAIENARLFDEAQRKTRELAGLYDAALATSSELDTQALLHRLYEQVRQIIAPDTFAVVLYDAEAQEIEVALAIEQGQPLPNLRAPLREGSLSGWVIRTRQPLFISDLQTEALSVEIKHITTPARTWLGVPLIAHDRVIGVVSIQSFRPRAFDEAHLRFLESLAGQVAVALENAQLYAEAHNRAAELGQLYQALADEKHRLELLYHLSQNLTATLDPREVA